MIDVAAKPEKLIPVPSPFEAVNKRNLIVIEFLTILILVTLTFWSVGPLIEEWGLFRAFNENGLAYFQTFAPSIPMRPLHLVAYAFQWMIGWGHPVGVALGTASLMIIRYFVARWAVSPFIGGYKRWLLAVLAATLVFWPGAWMGRYGSAQLSAILFFVSLGFSIRLYGEWSIKWVVGSAVSVALLLSIYQGLTLCLFAIPVLAIFWKHESSSGVFINKARFLSVTRISFAIGAGFLIYGLYWIIVSSKFGNSGYEGALASDSARLLTVVGLTAHIKSAYITAFGQETYLLPFLLALAFFMSWGALQNFETLGEKISGATLIFLFVTLLPILSMIYVNVLHIRDLDRVLYPVSVGFVLVCISLLARFREHGSFKSDLLNSSVVVVVVLTSSVVVAHGVRHYVQLQRSVISQMWAALETHDASTVLVRDYTGTLGDVYTFLSTTLGDASTVLGRKLVADICTPAAVDRIHPVAQRFPITTTPRCEDLPVIPETTLVLTARWLNGVLVVTP
ncbi:hypothetical protein [Pseudomonas sp. KK4]|uniref:hypothetical protein n=1 Tax=Pseudomonas sp. KK4 TaxID=1855729 RepID=UPI0011157AF9|nr:hypothetical protein [Pseudomonas sp. KK4]